MLVTVATETRVGVRELLDAPYWLTLYTYYHVLEARARVALERRRERVDMGFLTAHAFNEPRNLLDELRAIQEAIAAQDRPSADGVSDLRARGEAMVARMAASGAFPDLLGDVS